MQFHLTEDELVETLKRSSLTTILVEGQEDIVIYRWIEEEIGINSINFLPCGGRTTLLRVFARRQEFSQLNVLFIADRDTWVYSSVPSEYHDIIWTNGYSIENDLYNKDQMEKLLDVKEKPQVALSLRNFLRYYAAEYEKCLAQVESCFRYHPTRVLDANHDLDDSFAKEIGFVEPSSDTIQLLQSQYTKLVRGKSLFALLLRILSHSSRGVKHNRLSLYEHCFKLSRTQYIERIITEIRAKI